MGDLELPSSEPIAVTTESTPFRSCLVRESSLYVDLHALGYVEEEFHLRGRADAQGLDAEVLEPDAPYTTRVLVRRPEDPARFSGTLHLEPFHHLMEDTPAWTAGWGHMTRTGDAWVGVTISAAHETDRRVRMGGVPRLKEFDAERYGPLDLRTFPEPGPNPYGGTGPSGFDAEAFLRLMRLVNAQGPGIVAQLAASAKAADPDGPLGGWPVERVYAAGWSQTGLFWCQFLDDGHHETSRAAGGGPLFDAYLNAVTTSPRAHPADAVVVHLLSETEIVGTLRPPDCVADDTDAPRFRGYEVPGSFHYWEQKPRAGRQMEAGEHSGPHNDRPWRVLVHALYHHLDRWVAKGVPMPHGPRVARDPEAPDGVGRDADGNALGGIRTVWLDLPSARYLPKCACSPVVGAMQPFPPEEMARRYGSLDGYLARVEGSAAEMVAAGWLLPEDVSTVVTDARRDFD